METSSSTVWAIVSYGTQARVSNTADDRHMATLMAKVTPCARAAIAIFLKVHVRSDMIVGVEPDLAKAPYIKDKGKSATSGS
jgi:hypothetical protein